MDVIFGDLVQIGAVDLPDDDLIGNADQQAVLAVQHLEIHRIGVTEIGEDGGAGVGVGHQAAFSGESVNPVHNAHGIVALDLNGVEVISAHGQSLRAGALIDGVGSGDGGKGIIVQSFCSIHSGSPD